MFNKTLTFVVWSIFHLIALPLMLVYALFCHIGYAISVVEGLAFESGWFDEDVMEWLGERVAFVYSCFGLDTE